MCKNCVLSFFDNAYQRELKISCIENVPFEKVIKKYRDTFLNEMDKIVCLDVNRQCRICDDCLLRCELSPDYASFLNEFRNDIITRKDLIKKLFNEIIAIYVAAISKNRAVAMDMMKGYIENRCGYFNVDGAMMFSKPMFRVRKTGAYDGNDIHELFHVPFDKRYLVGNERFSLAGIPLLYVSESLPIALQEVGCTIKQANAAVFLPNYSINFKQGVYDISNPMASNLINIGVEMHAGCKLTYDRDLPISFKKSDMHQYIARFLLVQILHYPVNESCKRSFVQEYVMPQLLMDIVNEKSWIGVSYYSCKKYKFHRDDFKQFANRNICFNVPYCNEKYNEEFLSKFFYATWCTGEDIVSYKELMRKMAYIESLNRKGMNAGFNMNDYMQYYSRILQHIETMEKIIGKQRYKIRKDCRVEMTLFFKLLEKIEMIISDPEKYGIIQMDRCMSSKKGSSDKKT